MQTYCTTSHYLLSSHLNQKLIIWEASTKTLQNAQTLKTHSTTETSLKTLQPLKRLILTSLRSTKSNSTKNRCKSNNNRMKERLKKAIAWWPQTHLILMEMKDLFFHQNLGLISHSIWILKLKFKLRMKNYLCIIWARSMLLRIKWWVHRKLGFRLSLPQIQSKLKKLMTCTETLQPLRIS